EVLELQAYFEPAAPDDPAQALPGAGLRVPIWLLGSSPFGAQLAAELGLPYALAPHFPPTAPGPALEPYRTGFKPSSQLQRPYAAAGVNIFAAKADAEARWLFTSAQQQFANLMRGKPGKLPPPTADIETYWNPVEKVHAESMLTYSF